MLTKERLSQFLIEAIELFEGRIEKVEIRKYISALYFLKRLSDQFEEEQSKITGDKNDPDNYQFFLPPSAHWGNIRSTSEAIGEKIDDIFKIIEENNQLLEKILTPVQFNNPNILHDNILNNLIVHFSRTDFNLCNSSLENEHIIGLAFEDLIRNFADYEGKKVSYTPKGVVKVLVGILQPNERMRICDPACGSGGMLIESIVFLETQEKNVKNISIYGEEKKPDTHIIAKMNLIFHDLLDVVRTIKLGDTFKEPLLENGQLMKFDLILSNPIWNDEEWDVSFFQSGDPYGRILYDLPPKGTADWLWIQHMLVSLNENGRIGIVLDNGALFRGGREGKIRKAIIEDGLIEGVIALPSKLFYKGSGPGSLIILNKVKSESLQKKIFFIYAENEFEAGKAMNFLREAHIQKIVSTFNSKEIINKFSDLIDLEEIKENDYNLNVSRYIDILPDEDPIDLDKCLDDLVQKADERSEIEAQFRQNMTELGFKHFSKLRKT